MDYDLTEHARNALEKRGIEIRWMERVFDRPETTEADLWTPIWSIGWRDFRNGAIVCCVL